MHHARGFIVATVFSALGVVGLTPTHAAVATGTTRAVADFDGDGITDIAVYRPSGGIWYIHQSSNGVDVARQYGGVAGDIPVPADYDGDGKADVSSHSTNEEWYIVPSTGGGAQDVFVNVQHVGNVPIPADYDGDGKADLGEFNPSNGQWIVYPGPVFRSYGGASGDIPVPGDYQTPNHVNVAIFRPSTGTWFIGEFQAPGDTFVTYGIPGDVPLQLEPSVQSTFFP